MTTTFFFEGGNHDVYTTRPFPGLVVRSKGIKRTSYTLFTKAKLTFNKWGCYVQADGKTIKVS